MIKTEVTTVNLLVNGGRKDMRVHCVYCSARSLNHTPRITSTFIIFKYTLATHIFLHT